MPMRPHLVNGNMKFICDVTQNRLFELFEYREDGNLIWIQQRGNRKPGDIAGSKNKQGRLGVSVDGVWYLLHRLIWLYHKGYLPTTTIDHKDCNCLNNKIDNLRVASLEQQNFNKPVRKTNKFPKWVSYDKRRPSPYIVRVTINKKTYYIGAFKNMDEASKAGNMFAKKYQGEFYNDN